MLADENGIDRSAGERPAVVPPRVYVVRATSKSNQQVNFTTAGQACAATIEQGGVHIPA